MLLMKVKEEQREFRYHSKYIYCVILG